MTLSCYIVDDEEHAIKVLKRHVENTPGLAVFGWETDPVAAWDRMVNRHLMPDLLFLDIDMPRISGLSLAGLVKSKTQIIFTTAHPDYAVEAFEADAVDYLMKPVSYQRFLQAIAKVRQTTDNDPEVQHTGEEAFYVKSDGKGAIARIRFEDIVYIEGKGNFVEIMAAGEKHIVYLSLKRLGQQLPEERFVRVNRSFIINLEKVSIMKDSRILMEDNSPVEIGPTYKQDLLALINPLLIDKKP